MEKATIKAGESLSNAVELRGAKHFALDIPDDFTGTSVSFQAGGWDFNMKDLYDCSGNEVVATVTAGKMCSLDSIAAALAPYRSLKIRSGTAQAPTVQQGVDAASVVVNFGDSKTLTITSGVKGTRGNVLYIHVEMNETDTLVVTNPEGGIIMIEMASTTASKNSASAIQAAVRALGTVAGVDVSGVTVVGSAEYNAAPAVGVRSAIVADFGDSKTLTISYSLGGVQGDGIPVRIENNTSDNLSVTNPADTEQVLIKLATTTGSKNSAAAIQAAIRALGTVGDYDLSAVAVAGSSAYNAAPAAGVKAVRNITYLDASETPMGTLTLTAGRVGAEGGPIMEALIADKVEANSADTLSVTWYDYEGNSEPLPECPTLQIKLANATASKNAASAIKSAIDALMASSPLTSDTVYGGVYADLQPFITGFALAGDAVWTASPPVTTPDSSIFDSSTFVEGRLPLTAPMEQTTDGGEDVADSGQPLEGGTDPEIVVILKE